MARQVEGDEWALQCEGHRVEGVGVLCATVNEYEFGLTLTPAQSTQLTKSVDGDEEALNARNLNVEVPFVDVLVKKRKFIIGIFGHAPERRRSLLEIEG